jgi:lysophospholipase L1-like esterase
MATKEAIAKAVEDGRQRAVATYRRSLQPGTFAGTFQGYLIAEGDSWFDYPLFEDIVESLEDDHGYKVKSAAHHGDTVTDMAYDPSQLRRLNEIFQEMKDAKQTPRAIILSGGGNDVVGALAVLLNHRGSGLGPINASVQAGVLNEQIPLAIGSLIGAVQGLSQQHFNEARPILIHGYAAPVPDGRGYPVLGLSGPWMKPVFAQRGWVSQDPQPDAELLANTQTIGQLINAFNDQVLPGVVAAAGPGVTYVDIRPALRNDLASYRQDWRDEMHAMSGGFKAAATLFDAAIQKAAPTIPQ